MQCSGTSGHTFTSNDVTGGRAHYGDVYGGITYNINYDVYSQHSFDIGREERIGVLASMPGLLGITGAIHLKLKAFADIQGADTSRIFFDASSSVAACRLTLESFRRRLTLLDLSSERAALIKVDKLVILFAHAILLFEELAILLKQGDNGHVPDTERLATILERVREQNYAWGLQDFILSNPDEQIARNTVTVLDGVASRLLTGQDDLRRRLSDFQDQVQESALRPGDMTVPHSPAPQHPIYAEQPGPSIQTQRLSMTPAEFEQALNESWVYRRNRERMGSMSFRDSVSFGWSELSGLSLADISVISVIALPIQVSELEYGNWYLDEDHSQVQQSENTPHQDHVQQSASPASSEYTVICWPAPGAGDRTSGMSERSHIESSSGFSQSALPLDIEQGQPDSPAPRQDGGQQSAEDILVMSSIRESLASLGLSGEKANCFRDNPDCIYNVQPPPKPRDSETSTGVLYSWLPLDTQHGIPSSSGFRPSLLDCAPVLFPCASIFDFETGGPRTEGAFSYLTYASGEVFDVFAQKGELWLARNQDDTEKQLGWIWEQHFVRLSDEIVSQEAGVQDDAESNVTMTGLSSDTDNTLERVDSSRLLNFI